MREMTPDEKADMEMEIESAQIREDSSHEFYPQLMDIEREGWEETHNSKDLNDISAGRIVRPPWLFEDFLLSNTLTLVSGEPFAGKTMLLMAMMLSLDSGEPLAGAFVPQPKRRVLFVGQDAPTWDYMGQIQKLSRGLPNPTTNFSKCIFNNGFNILEPRFLKMVEEAVNLFNINILMLDTLLELHGMDENSNTEMRQVMKLLKHLRDKHFLSIIVTTHTAKATDQTANYRARGASVIAGSVDQHILVRPHFAEGKPDGFYFKVPKSRGAQREENANVIKFVSSEVEGSPSLQLVYSGELYAERQAHAIRLVSNGIVARKDILAEMAKLYPTWSRAELQRRITNTLSFLTRKGRLSNPERGIYSLPEASNPS